MRAFQAAVRRLSKGAAVISAALLVLMVLHILLEITLRSFFATSTFVLDEFVGYGVAAMTFLTLGYALEKDALIRVQLALTRSPAPVRRGLETLCASLTLALSLFLIGHFWRSVSRNWGRSAVSQSIAEVPLWIPEGLVLLGLVLFALQLFAHLLRLVRPMPVED
ncbi:MAG TPA: TRAP transporter small permease [Geminicoccaceae bacterium]|nr:TRAP transporter small permease [Geminicoccaceae bacterium]